MGFCDGNGNRMINAEHKVRIPLSEHARIILLEDKEIFGFRTETTFINEIFKNYYEDARSSLKLQRGNRRNALERTFRDVALSSKSRQDVINRLLDAEENEFKESLRQNLSSKNVSGKLYHISKANIDYLFGDLCQEDYPSPGAYMRSVIEEYCSLPFIERERIIRKDIYEEVENALRESNALKVHADFKGQDTEFYVYPYKIVSDPLHTQSYLACYSRFRDESENDKKTASFSMLKIKRVKEMRSEKVHLTKKEKEDLERQITASSPVYLLGNTVKIKVKLTDPGKRLYHSNIISRPVRDISESSEDSYVFNCSPRQALNYFLPFGKEAEIISPEGLRNQFHNIYQQAADKYRK